MNKQITLLTSALALALVGCGGSSSSTNNEDPTPKTTDTTKPVLTLTGKASMSLEQGQTFTDPGATATDNMDGNLTSQIQTSGSVDTNTPGSYTVTYTVTDAAGNKATLTRAITITETVPVVVTPVQKMPLNDTGIMFSGNIFGGLQDFCQDAEDHFQQDCHFGRDGDSTFTKVGAGHGGFDFTKLDMAGNALADDAPEWACVRDNHTGLIWETKIQMTVAPAGNGLAPKKKGGGGGGGSTEPTPEPSSLPTAIQSGSRKFDQKFKWGGTSAQIKEGQTYGTQYDEWNSLINDANTESLCGITDWRVPSRGELTSILNYHSSLESNDKAAADTNYFPHTQLGYYWSSTPYAGASERAWAINFDSVNGVWWGTVHYSGEDNAEERSFGNYVRLVHLPAAAE